jgi:penicillin-binding protein 1A
MRNHTKPGSHPTEKKQRAERGRAAKRERRHPVWRIIGITFGVIGAFVIVGLGAGVGYATSLLKGLPSISADTITNLSQPSVVYDVHGKLIGQFSADGDRQPIASTQQVSPNLVNAFIAAEDKTFYQNIGVNPLAMGRAFVQDLLHHQIQSGASTITQQTVKLAMFPDQQRTTKRKVQEIALAVEANHMLTKDEIMTDYMNWVYMGWMGTQNVYGVKSASTVLFKKDPKDLNLPEAAFLAAIPNNASLFSPYKNPKNTLQRQHYILGQMLADGMISQTEYDSAMKFDVLKALQTAPANQTIPYPYLMKDDIEPAVAQFLVQSGKYSSTDDALKALPTAGYKIYTSIDLDAQRQIDQVLQTKSVFGSNSDVQALDKNGKPLKGPDGKPLMDMYEAGVTLMDNQTGGILAIGGGRDYLKDQYDHSDIARQPGSSMKPIMDYGPAIETHQLTAASPIMDAPVTYPGANGNPWKPVDDVPGWHGIMTAREALVQSMNIPAIKVLDQITPQVGGSFLEKMGITPDAKTLFGHPTLDKQDLQHLSSAIGGLTNGLTVQQMTSAYTVFPNQGIWRQPFLVSKISDPSGNVVYQFKPVTQKVFSAQTSYIMTSILHDVVYKPEGTAYSIGANFPGYNISGKTGTTDDQRDGWFIGYTQKYTMGIWMGYNNHQYIRGDLYNLKFNIWNKMMTPLLKQNPPTAPFPEPPNIVNTAVCNKSGQLPTQLCKADNDVYNELFIQGTEPTASCQVHVQAQYTVVNGKKYLATTNTPVGEIQTGVFLKPLSPAPAGTVTYDSGEYIPTQADPRGGTVLTGTGGNPGNTPPALPAPAGVQATLSNGVVSLNWSDVTGATGYTVSRATSPNGPYVSIAGPMPGTTYADNGIPKGTKTVYYQIYALSDSGISGPSDTISLSLAGGGPGTGNTTGGTGNTTGAKTTTNGTGMPDFLWPQTDVERSRG